MANDRRISLVRPSQLFDSFMDEFFNAPSLRFSSSDVQMDMFENDNNIVVKLKAPGFKKDDLEINIEGDSLTVSGNISEESESEEKSKKYFMKEIKEESFSRTIALPSKVDPEQAEAKVKDGIVEISLPKIAESKPKKIAISAE